VSFVRKQLTYIPELLVLVAVYLAVSVAMTWPMGTEIGRQVVGGGEFGGWLWRQWWHFQEIEALANSSLSLLDHVRQLVSLGRYPETGNILDVLLLSYPLDQWLGFPFHHNVKVLLIMVGNGLCAYWLARGFTDSRVVAWAAGCVAVVNPLVIVDVNGTGLRQVLLWWLLLFPVSLSRATRNARMIDGVWVGVVFTLVSAFYWFYGLFAAMFGLMWIAHWWWTQRPPWGRIVRWMVPAAVVAVFGLILFLLPYFAAGSADPMRSTMADLPELSFFLSFPAYDTIAAAPLRPTNYEENVLSSLRRVIVSSWPADHVVNPFHGVKAFPALVFLAGVLPCLVLRRVRFWLVVWVVFWLGTMGPFLKLGADQDSTDVIFLGDFVIRMPWTWMFKWIPGMSRMFAPYRMSAMMVVSGVVLLASGLHALRGSKRPWIAALVGLGVVIQPFWHIDVGPVAEGVQRPPVWRIPGVVSPFDVPDWYMNLKPEGREGIIEVPLEQQQDLMCVYQAFHHQKVYRSWAGAPAVPPMFRNEGGGEAGDRLRWLAEGEVAHGELENQLLTLSRDPLNSELSLVEDVELASLMDGGEYRWLIVHERGYYLVDPHEGGVLYRDALRRISERWNLEPVEVYEHGLGIQEDTHLTREVAPAWIPMAGKDVSVPLDQIPRRMMMAIYDLAPWRDQVGPIEIPIEENLIPPQPGEDRPGAAPAQPTPPGEQP
jgi:hypothetical protein